jgi:alpha-D-xyloside xylohydrolase
VLVAAPVVAQEPPAVRVTQTSTEVAVASAGVRVVVDRLPWRLRIERPDGTVLAQEADPALPDPPTNPDRALYQDRDGDVDAAYPGLPSVSYQPLGFLRDGSWRHVTAVDAVQARDDGVSLDVLTSDGGTGRVELSLDDSDTLALRFTPPAGSTVTAVEEAFAAPVGERYLGGGQRFGAIDTRGRSIPLWISHGISSDRYTSTNEIAAPFLIGTRGWGLHTPGTARGEINAALPFERPDALNVVLEQATLDLRLYVGTPQQVLSRHTLDVGRPLWTPPQWVWQPMAWRDQDTDEQAVRALVERHEQERLPLGAVWVDNPFEKRIGDLDRYQDFDRLVDDLHAKGLRVVTWVSPYVTEGSRLDVPLQGVGGLVTGTPEHNDDSTYLPRRGLSPHVDYTSPQARRIWQSGLEDLLARGVDGVKADRGEEDLSDGAVFADGRPNRLNHNDYVRLYDETMFDAFQAQGRGDDFLVIARGGYSGSARHAAQWAGDNVSLAGPAGLEQALNGLLSLSMSGFPWSGSDIGGYVGTRQDRSGDPVGVPTKGTYLRWAQLGALSPVMQTAIPPYEFDAETVDVYRRYAELHTALAPYTAAAAELSRTEGIPIVRPLPFAFPDDPVAQQSDDSYLYGPDLLVAPIHDSSAETGGPGVRQVHLPAGGWTDFWTGQRFTGPTTMTVVAPLDVLPLYVRDGARLPAAVDAMRVPPAGPPPTQAGGEPPTTAAPTTGRQLPATGGSAASVALTALLAAGALYATRRRGDAR